MSILASESAAGDVFLLPTETEIYILPDGEVVFADLPLELAPAAQRLGKTDQKSTIRANDMGSDRDVHTAAKDG